MQHSGSKAKGWDLLASLRKDDDESEQLAALTELCNVLSMATEDTMPELRTETLVPLLVQCLRKEHSIDHMLFSSRALTYLMEAMPASAAIVVQSSAVSVLCEKLLSIEYIDLAEQCLLALEKISHEHPGALLSEGGLGAMLSFVDFFGIAIQRKVVLSAANICKRVPKSLFHMLEATLPTLVNFVSYPDSKIVEHAVTCFWRLVVSFGDDEEKLIVIASDQLLTALLDIITPSRSARLTAQSGGSSSAGKEDISQATQILALRTLAAFGRGSVQLTDKLLKNGIGNVVHDLLLAGTTQCAASEDQPPTPTMSRNSYGSPPPALGLGPAAISPPLGISPMSNHTPSSEMTIDAHHQRLGGSPFASPLLPPSPLPSGARPKVISHEMLVEAVGILNDLLPAVPSPVATPSNSSARQPFLSASRSSRPMTPEGASACGSDSTATETASSASTKKKPLSDEDRKLGSSPPTSASSSASSSTPASMISEYRTKLRSAKRNLDHPSPSTSSKSDKDISKGEKERTSKGKKSVSASASSSSKASSSQPRTIDNAGGAKWFSVIDRPPPCDSCRQACTASRWFRCNTCRDYNLCDTCFPNPAVVHSSYGSSASHEFTDMGALNDLYREGVPSMALPIFAGLGVVRNSVTSNKSANGAARCTLFSNSPSLIESLSTNLPVLMGIYQTTMHNVLKSKCLMIITKLLAYMPLTLLESVLRPSLPIASFLANLMHNGDSSTVSAALSMAEDLMTKLPEVFQTLFVREGVLNEVSLLCSKQPESLPLSPPGGSRALDAPSSAIGATAAVVAKAREFHQRHFASLELTSPSDMGMSPIARQLRRVATDLRSHAERTDAQQCASLREACSILSAEQGVSTFEFLSSDLASALLFYLRDGMPQRTDDAQPDNFPSRSTDPKLLVILQRAARLVSTFGRVPPPPVAGSGLSQALAAHSSAIPDGSDDVPMDGVDDGPGEPYLALLVRQAQASFVQVERLPIYVTESGGRVGEVASSSSVGSSSLNSLRLLTQPFKLTLVPHASQGGASGSCTPEPSAEDSDKARSTEMVTTSPTTPDGVSAAAAVSLPSTAAASSSAIASPSSSPRTITVMIDPLATVGAIEDFVRSKLLVPAAGGTDSALGDRAAASTATGTHRSSGTGGHGHDDGEYEGDDLDYAEGEDEEGEDSMDEDNDHTHASNEILLQQFKATGSTVDSPGSPPAVDVGASSADESEPIPTDAAPASASPDSAAGGSEATSMATDTPADSPDALATTSPKSSRKCPAGHQLSLTTLPSKTNGDTYEKYMCDGCKGNFVARADPVLHCIPCEFDLCPTCASGGKPPTYGSSARAATSPDRKVQISLGDIPLPSCMTIYQAVYRYGQRALQLKNGKEVAVPAVSPDTIPPELLQSSSWLWHSGYTATYQAVPTPTLPSSGPAPTSSTSADGKSLIDDDKEMTDVETGNSDASSSAAGAATSSTADSTPTPTLDIKLSKSDMILPMGLIVEVYGALSQPLLLPSFCPSVKLDAKGIEILSLLRLLHTLNRHGPGLLVYLNSVQLPDSTPAFVTVPRQIPDVEFVNSKLTNKLSRQIQDPLLLCTGYLPHSWCYALAVDCPFLFAFSTRRRFFELASFGAARAMLRLQQALTDAGEQPSFRLGRVQKQKIRLARHHVLESARKVMDRYGSHRALLEIEYFGEIGTGLGPTLEFYTLVSRDLLKKSLMLWRDDRSLAPEAEPMDDDEELDDAAAVSEHSQGSRRRTRNSSSRPPRTTFTMMAEDDTPSTSAMEEQSVAPTPFNEEDYIVAPRGLFPAVPSAAHAKDKVGEDDRLDWFRFVGSFVARALADGRMIDLPFSLPLLKILRGGTIGLPDVEYVQPDTFATLVKLTAIADRYDELLRTGGNVHPHTDDLLFDGKCAVEDLCLDFTLPGAAHVELRPGGADIVVTAANARDYVADVVRVLLYDSIAAPLRSFAAGFNVVFPITQLRLFTVDELDQMLCGSTQPLSMEVLDDAVICNHGYTLSSRAVRFLFQVIVELDSRQTRKLIQFLTGAPRLPVGGLKALRPHLTIVRKTVDGMHNNESSSPDPSSATSMSPTPGASSSAPSSFADDWPLPSVMTCANYLKLPDYPSVEITRVKLLQAIEMGQESFHLS